MDIQKMITGTKYRTLPDAAAGDHHPICRSNSRDVRRVWWDLNRTFLTSRVEQELGLLQHACSFRDSTASYGSVSSLHSNVDHKQARINRTCMMFPVRGLFFDTRTHTNLRTRIPYVLCPQ